MGEGDCKIIQVGKATISERYRSAAVRGRGRFTMRRNQARVHFHSARDATACTQTNLYNICV